MEDIFRPHILYDNLLLRGVFARRPSISLDANSHAHRETPSRDAEKASIELDIPTRVRNDGFASYEGVSGPEEEGVTGGPIRIQSGLLDKTANLSRLDALATSSLLWWLFFFLVVKQTSGMKLS
jgi:hypothetical protein